MQFRPFAPVFVSFSLLVATTTDGVALAQDSKIQQAGGLSERPLSPTLTNDSNSNVPAGATQLLNNAAIDRAKWSFITANRAADLDQTWSVRKLGGELVVHCSGEPFGLLRASHRHADFRIGIEYRFPSGQPGNSGLLIYTGNEQTVWPRSVQVQFHEPGTGLIVPVGGARVGVVEQLNEPIVAKPDHWNSCVVSSISGKLSVFINGTLVSTAQDCDPKSGGFGLQSEGAEVQFRRIWIMPVDGNDEGDSSVVPASAAESAKPNRADDAVDLRNAPAAGDLGIHCRSHLAAQVA